jgi:UDP-N-acetylmuramoylalanine--D-glutamate ligase
MTPFTLNHLGQLRIALFGLGREGWSTYQFLRQRWPDKKILLIDDLPVEKLSNNWQTAQKNDANLSLVTSDQAPPLLAEVDLVIKTPGIPLSHPLLAELRNRELPHTSNMQLLFDLLTTELNSEDYAKTITIGVSGTKGKSTTTSLIHHVLHTAGEPAVLGGNIGVPPLDLWSEIQTILDSASAKRLFVVLEMSSHQLAELTSSPQIAVIQNIVPEHLDYYPDFASYVEAKSHLTRFQKPTDLVIFNPEYEYPTQLAQLSAAHQQTFTTLNSPPWGSLLEAPIKLPPVATIHDHQLFYGDEAVLKVEELPLLGTHNWDNVMPALMIGKHFGLSTETIRQGLKTFKPLPHRLEPVATINDVLYVNDSLSTAPEAAAAAIHAFHNREILLLAGGYDRHLDYTKLAQAIFEHRVRTVLLFKPTGEQIAEKIREIGALDKLVIPKIEFVDSMAEAVVTAARLAKPGSVVLMSPASASFGQFKDYRDRGDQFKKAVLALNE